MSDPKTEVVDAVTLVEIVDCCKFVTKLNHMSVCPEGYTVGYSKKLCKEA